jgi:hypothetical protein
MQTPFSRSRWAISFTFVVACAYSGCAAPTQGDGADDGVLDESDIVVGEGNTEGYKDIPPLTDEEKATILAKYASVPHEGIRPALYEQAILYYDTNYKRLPNKDVVTVIDFASHSGQKRFFVLDMKDHGPLMSYVTSHGKNSDPNDDGMADTFSNVEGSLQSSVGFYVTGETYISPRNGESLRLDGLSKTNNAARQRLIVVHPAAYVDPTREKQGLSFGCPALSRPEAPVVIARIKNGSLIYAMQ